MDTNTVLLLFFFLLALISAVGLRRPNDNYATGSRPSEKFYTLPPSDIMQTFNDVKILNTKLMAELNELREYHAFALKVIKGNKEDLANYKAREDKMSWQLRDQQAEITGHLHHLKNKDEIIQRLREGMHKLNFDYASEVANRSGLNEEIKALQDTLYIKDEIIRDLKPETAAESLMRYVNSPGENEEGTLAAVWKYENVTIDEKPYIRTKARKPYERKASYIYLPADADMTRDRVYLLSLEIDPSKLNGKIKVLIDKKPLAGEWVDASDAQNVPDHPEKCPDPDCYLCRSELNASSPKPEPPKKKNYSIPSAGELEDLETDENKTE